MRHPNVCGVGGGRSPSGGPCCGGLRQGTYEERGDLLDGRRRVLRRAPHRAVRDLHAQEQTRPWYSGRPGRRGLTPLFTQLRIRCVLRTSPLRSSKKCGLLYAACPFSGRTTNTGQWAWRTTESDTLPISARLTPPSPLLPITIRSAWSSSAKATISRSTAPILR